MTDSEDPVLGPLLGRSCPSCGLASRLTAARSGVGASCARCEGLFVPDEALTPVLGNRRRSFPPTLPPDARERLQCPRCDEPLFGVLCAGISAGLCPSGHGVFFDRERRRLFERLLQGGTPDVVSAGHQTGTARLSRPTYLQVFTDKVEAPPSGARTWAAVALVAVLLAVAYKLGA